MQQKKRTILILGCFACVAACVSAAFAADAPLSQSEIKTRLLEGNAQQVEQALTYIKEQKPKGGAALIAARIRQGLPSSLIVLALDSFVASQPNSQQSRIVAELAGHRNESVRQKSLQLLRDLKVPGNYKIYVTALSDPSSQVRQQAAELLVEAKVSLTIPKLIEAYEKGIKGAEKVWKIAEWSDIQKHLLSTLNAENLERRMRPIEVVMLREDLFPKQKSEVVQALARIQTTRCIAFLRELYVRLANQVPVSLRQEIQQVLREMDEAIRKSNAPAQDKTQPVSDTSKAKSAESADKRSTPKQPPKGSSAPKGGYHSAPNEASDRQPKKDAQR